MLLALVRLSWEERRPSWVRGWVERADLWIIAGVGLWALTAALFFRAQLEPALLLASFLVIGACVLPIRPGPITNALQWRPLAVLGVASYSLYLWHVPIIDLLRDDVGVSESSFPAFALVCAPIVIAVALASYAAVEAPFLRLRRQWSRSAAKKDAPAGSGS